MRQVERVQTGGEAPDSSWTEVGFGGQLMFGEGVGVPLRIGLGAGETEFLVGEENDANGSPGGLGKRGDELSGREHGGAA